MSFTLSYASYLYSFVSFMYNSKPKASVYILKINDRTVIGEKKENFTSWRYQLIKIYVIVRSDILLYLKLKVENFCSGEFFLPI